MKPAKHWFLVPLSQALRCVGLGICQPQHRQNGVLQAMLNGVPSNGPAEVMPVLQAMKKQERKAYLLRLLEPSVHFLVGPQHDWLDFTLCCADIASAAADVNAAEQPYVTHGTALMLIHYP